MDFTYWSAITFASVVIYVVTAFDIKTMKKLPKQNSTTICNNNEISRNGFFSKVKMYFLEFSENTSVHGFKFLGERNTTVFEKFWWFCVITASLVICIACIAKVYHKWTNSPVIVSFATSQTSIRDIPFPAVTICPDVKTRKQYFNYTKVFYELENGVNVSNSDYTKYNYLNLICETKHQILDSNIKFTNTDALDFFTDVTSPIHSIVRSLTWQGIQYQNSTNFFTPILNAEGVCYTFNILDRTDLFKDYVQHYKHFYSNGNVSSWNIEEGFDNFYEERYPRHSLVSGTDGGIDLLLAMYDEDIDYNCNSNFVGFKITVQHPGLIPRGKKQYFNVPLDQNILAAVKPIMMETSQSLVYSQPKKRQCYFRKEKSLFFYKQYNQPNCLLECLTNYTFKICGCVGFHMPKLNSTPICGSGSNKCISNARATYLSENGRFDETTGKKHKSYFETCDCLPTCYSLDFEVELSQSNFDWKHKYNYSQNHRKMHLSRLRIFFKDMQFITSARNELYTTTDFIANCGGLLGLFMGFSTISMFEIIYFVTVRWVCKIRKNRKNQMVQVNE